MHNLKTKPNLVLLHGWGFHSDIWQPLLPHLTDFNIICIDLPGFGKNTHFPKDYSLNEIIEKILKIAPPHANYLGWSLGGLIAMAIAIYFPKRVQRLITVGSTPCFLESENWPGMSNLFFQNFSEELDNNYPLTLKRFLLMQLKDLGSLKIIRTITDNMLQHVPHKDVLQSSLALLKNSDLREPFKKIECPQLHCYGEMDALVPASITVQIEKLSPRAKTHLFTNTGHIPFLSQTEPFIALLKNYLYEQL